MRILIVADDVGYDEVEGDASLCLVCGVRGRDAGGAGHYMMFQGDADSADADDDPGVHFEFDDQSNGDYNCVARCALTRASLEVELTDAARQETGVVGLRADLSGIDDPSYDRLRVGLARIFRETDGILELA